MSRASRSLPTPVSPRIRMVSAEGATRRARCSTACIKAEWLGRYCQLPEASCQRAVSREVGSRRAGEPFFSELGRRSAGLASAGFIGHGSLRMRRYDEQSKYGSRASENNRKDRTRRREILDRRGDSAGPAGEVKEGATAGNPGLTVA